MESCETYRDGLAALLGGELEADAAAALRAHVEGCAECGAEYEAFEATVADLHALGDAFAANAPDVRVGDVVMGDLDALHKRVGPTPEKTGEGAGPTHEKTGEGAGPTPGKPCARASGEELLAYLDDALDAVRSEEIARRLASDPELRGEMAALMRIGEDVEAAGEAALGNVPEVDLKESILKRATALQTRKGRAVTPPEVAWPRTRGRRPLRAWLRLGLAAAAAAAVLIGILLLTREVSAPAPTGNLAQRQESTPSPVPEKIAGPEGATDSVKDKIEEETLPEPDVRPEPPLFAKDLKQVSPRPIALELTLDEVIRTHRLALMKDTVALKRVAQWASLAPGDARALDEIIGLSEKARIGASLFLPPEEAARILEEAVARDPEDPFLRFALAKNLGEDPERMADRVAELEAWQNLDPENALPHYMEAAARFEQGDHARGLDALDRTAAYEMATIYALDSALYRAAALEASGIDRDVARFLAAATAGAREYTELSELGQQLLQIGNYFEAEGDYETAEDVYSGVLQLGSQVDEGARFASEQVAGFDLQTLAINALQALYELIDDPDGLAQLAQLTNDVLSAASDLATLFERLNAVFNEGDIIALIDLILDYGDLFVPSE